MYKTIIIILLIHLQLSADAQFFLQSGSKIYMQSGAAINLQNIDLVNDGLITTLTGSKINFSGNNNNVIVVPPFQISVN